MQRVFHLQTDAVLCFQGEFQRYYAGWDGYSVDMETADVDKDGFITRADDMILSRYASEWGEEYRSKIESISYFLQLKDLYAAERSAVTGLMVEVNLWDSLLYRSV